MNIKDFSDAELNGRVSYSTWRKNASSMTTTANAWYDLTYIYGTNNFNYNTTPLTSKVLRYSTHGGMNVGPNITTNKYLRSTTIISVTTAPITFILCDYLMYYPFVQENTFSAQTMINSQVLSRYVDGIGVKIMAVSYSNNRNGNATFVVNYTNELGISGRTASGLTNTAIGFGNIITSTSVVASSIYVGSYGPFLTLQDLDKGVRSIQGVRMNNIDIGTFNLILVKPLAETQIRGIDAPVEKDYFLETGTAPEIKNDACLDWICLPTASIASNILIGDIKTIWT